MMLEEAQARLKKTKITEEQLWGLNSLYILLDLHKDDFCKIIDAVGLETPLNKRDHYEWLQKAEDELRARERYLYAKSRLKELQWEQEEMEKMIDAYKPI